MSKPLSKARRAALIGDLIQSERDVISIAREHGLSADEMADWISVPRNAHALRGLCRLADAQAQVLMSRYRLMAAAHLIDLAAPGGENATTEVSRRACVDILKMQLPGMVGPTSAPGLDEDEATQIEIESVIHQMKQTTRGSDDEEVYEDA